MPAKPTSVLAALTAIAFSTPVSPPTADAAPPAELRAIVETCSACHGKEGVSAMEGVPSLAAQPDIFIQYQLVFIRDGQRKVEAMQEIAKTLTDENIRDLGAYYASLPPPPAQAVKSDVDTDKVAGLLQQRHCDSCHKPDFSGQGESARLAGQRPEYLVKALSDFRAAVRRGRGLGVMTEVAVTLGDQDMEMIAAYLASKP